MVAPISILYGWTENKWWSRTMFLSRLTMLHRPLRRTHTIPDLHPLRPSQQGSRALESVFALKILGTCWFGDPLQLKKLVALLRTFRGSESVLM